MSEKTSTAEAQINEQNSPTMQKLASRKSKKTPTVQQDNKSDAPTIEPETPTENQVQTRGHIKQSELRKWTVFVRPEVKIAVQKSAKKAGITDTAWLDDKLWIAATDDLMRKSQPPAKVEDMADLLKTFSDSLKADQVAARQAQDELIKQQNEQIAALKDTVEAVANKPQPSIMQMIFGKKKDD